MYSCSYVLSLFNERNAYWVSFSSRFVSELRSCVVLQKVDSLFRQRLCYFSRALFLRTLEIFLSACRYLHWISLIMYVCTHPHCTYSSSSSFNMDDYIARCLCGWKAPVQVKGRWCIKYRWEVWCSSRVSRAPCSQWSQYLLAPIGVAVQSDVIYCALFLIGQLLSRSQSEVVQGSRRGKSSICITAIILT